MTNENSIALDLKVARQKAGLRQVDCAHLLGVTESHISRIESDRARPSVKELATLGIVYGKPMESLLVALRGEIVSALIERLKTIPPTPRDQPNTRNRTHTLSQLAIRLEALTDAEHGTV